MAQSARNKQTIKFEFEFVRTFLNAQVLRSHRNIIYRWTHEVYSFLVNIRMTNLFLHMGYTLDKYLWYLMKFIEWNMEDGRLCMPRNLPLNPHCERDRISLWEGLRKSVKFGLYAIPYSLNHFFLSIFFSAFPRVNVANVKTIHVSRHEFFFLFVPI